jgi:hypothetical protein
LKRTQIESSSIKSIGYEPEGKLLEIELRGGGIYQYFQVPPKVFDDLINAASAGRYYSKYVRAVYKYRKVR